jgi:hypothetical protein
VESLGLASNAPRSDGRLKTLLWPTIRHDGDLEHIAEQGFWICTTLAVFTLVLGTFAGGFFAALFDAAFFFLGGLGVRQRSLAASVVVFTAYLAAAVAAQLTRGSGFGVMTIIFLALLLANIRGIWLSAKWTPENDLPSVPRLNETFFDKLSGRWPEVLWPKAKWLFAVLATLEFIGISVLFFGPHLVRR